MSYILVNGLFHVLHKLLHRFLFKLDIGDLIKIDGQFLSSAIMISKEA
jgi:hypothetical protein